MSKIKWQDFLNILTLKGKDTGSVKNVKDAAEDINKFKICYNANKSYLEEWLERKTELDLKSPSKSEELRLQGNNIYKKGKDLEALNLYNSSIQAAPHNSNHFALALANRSAVLGRLGHHPEAIQDIDLALQHGDNEIPRTKWLIRKALLLHKLSLFKDAVSLMKSLFPNEDEIRTQDNVDLKNAYFDALMESENAASSKSAKQDEILPKPKGGENEEFSSASALVSLEFSEDKGRFVVARGDFEMADIIFVEKPFALVVLPDQYLQHCHHCCKKIVAFVPCAMCSRALFCSEGCRAAAWSRYHQWECRGLEVCHCIGIAHLGLRVALLADSSERYRQVFDLVTHIEDMNAEDIYQYTITAVLLTLYLEKYTSYFITNSSLDVNEMGCRILRHIAQLICNGHAITKIDSTLKKDARKTMTEAKVRIATAIYPSASMMNHSCDQNIANSFINEFLIVRACKPIKKGDEVFNCYGPHYASMSRDERQKLLQSQYFFTCDCRSCCQSSESELLQFSAMLCNVCSGPVMEGTAACADCRTPQPLRDMVDLALAAQQLFHRGNKLFKEGDIKNALISSKESVKISSKCLYKHNSDLRTYKDFLARLYAEQGRYDESITLTEECLISVEKQFGCNSMELSRELLKLFDLLTLDLKRLMLSGSQDSEEFRRKNARLKTVIKKTQKIIESSMDASLLNEIPGMTAALNNIKVL